MNGHTGTEKVNDVLHWDSEGKLLVILGQVREGKSSRATGD